MGRGHLWFSSYPTTSDPGGNFSKMPTFPRSGAWASSQLPVSSIPVLTSLPSLDPRGGRSPRVTSGSKRSSTGSESRAAPRPAGSSSSGTLGKGHSRGTATLGLVGKPRPITVGHTRIPANQRSSYSRVPPALSQVLRTPSRRRQSRLSLSLQPPPELTRASRLLAPSVVPVSFH